MLDYGSKGYWQKYYHDSVVKGQIYAEEWCGGPPPQPSPLSRCRVNVRRAPALRHPSTITDER